jgi:stage V sporulation protein G
LDITDIKIHIRNEDKLKAFATVTFDRCFVVHNLKIIESENKLIVCMPSRKMPDGCYKDVAHPITAEFRGLIEKTVFARYEEELRRGAVPKPAGVGSRVV